MKKIIFIFLLLTICFSSIEVKSDNSIYYKNLKYKDIIGKIEIPGTNINTYLLQTTNNNYYLNHSYLKKKNKIGSVFVDFRNNINNKKILIYGHNSNNNIKVYFKDLEKYKEKEFYKKNKYIKITLKNKKYNYKIFSINIVSNNKHTKINSNKLEFYREILKFKETSLYKTNVDIGQDDYIITLQTCNYKPKNTYLLINAKRV